MFSSVEIKINGHDITHKLPENKEFDKRKEEADKNIFKFIEQAYGTRAKEVIDQIAIDHDVPLLYPCMGCGGMMPIGITCWKCYNDGKYKDSDDESITCTHCRKDITNNEDIINVLCGGGELPFCDNKCFTLWNPNN